MSVASHAAPEKKAQPAKTSAAKGKPAKKRTASKGGKKAAAPIPPSSPDLLLPFPAVYAGTLPVCTDCPGISYQLQLTAAEDSSIRGSYELHRQPADSKEPPTTERGPWRLSYDYGKLILGGGKIPVLFAIKDHDTLVQLGIEGKPLDGGKNHLVRSTEPLAPEKPDALTAISWKLVRLMDTPVTPSDDAQRTPHFVLQAGEQRVTGSGGCNRFAGSFQRTSPDTLQFSDIVSTRMLCADGSDATHENQFFNTLNQTRSYRIQDQVLELLDATGVALARFEATEPPHSTSNPKLPDTTQP